MKKTFFLLMATFLAICGFSQSIITVGDGTNASSNSYVPSNMCYMNSVTQVIYLQSEIDMAGTIMSIGYNMSHTNSMTRPCKIYMGTTDKTSFTSSTDLVSADNLTLVYDGTVTFLNNEWTTINLNTAFEYANEEGQNLVVAFLDLSTNYSCSPYFVSTTTTDNRSVYSYADYTIPTTPDEILSYGPYSASYIPNTQFAILPEGEEPCMIPGGLTAVSCNSESITISWFGEEDDSFEVSYMLASETDWNNATTSTVTGNTFQATGLELNTQYQFRVARVCSTGNSDYSNVYTTGTTFEGVDLPYTTAFGEEDDQNWTLNSISGSNQWVIGTLENGTGALFVSSDGTTPGYDIESESKATAEKLFNLDDSPTVHVEFDVYVNGEAGYDFLKVFFASGSTNYSTSSLWATESYAVNSLDFSGYGFNNPALAEMSDTLHVIAAVPNPAPNGVGKLVFAWRNDGSWGDQPAAIISNIIVGDVACGTPTATVSNIETTTVTLNITTPGTSTIVRYKPTNDPEAEWTEETTSDTEYELSGLLVNTPYMFEVINDCGTETSLTFTGSFRTACGIIAELPQSWSFEDGIMTSSGTLFTPCLTRTNANYPYNFTTTDASDGSYVLYLYNGTSGIKYCSLPPIDTDVLPLSDVQLRFKSMQDPSVASIAGIVVGVMTDPTDATTFVPVDTVTPGNLVMQECDPITFTSYEGEGQYISFYYNYSGWYAAYVDEMVLEAKSECMPVAAGSIALSDMTAESVTVSWECETLDYGFNVRYREVSEEENEWNTETVSDPTIDIAGLSPATIYEFEVAPACDGEVLYRSITFTTLTEPAELPYITAFDPENEEDTKWVFHNLSNTGSSAWVMGTTTNDNNETIGALFVSTDGTTPGYQINTGASDQIVIVEKTFEVTDEMPIIHVEFDFKSGGESSYDYLKVFLTDASVEYNAGTSTTVCPFAAPAYATNALSFENYVSNTSFNNASTYPYRYNLTNGTVHISGGIVNPVPEGGIVKLAFVWRNDSSGGSQPGAIISNLVVGDLPCGTPSAVVTDITPNSATINIQGSADSYIVRYKKASDTEWINELNTTETSVELSELDVLTLYTVQVESNCEYTGPSAPIYTLNFRTACDLITTLPQTWDMESYDATGYNVPYCWSKPTVEQFPYAYSYSYYAASGSTTLSFGWNDGAIAVLPAIDTEVLPINTLQLTLKSYSYQSQSSIIVGIMTDPTDATTFEPIDTITSGSSTGVSMQESAPVYFDSYEGEGTFIALKGLLPTQQSLYVDDVTLDVIPACPPVDQNITVAVTENSALVSWIGEAENGFTVRYKESSAEEWIEETTTENSILLENLTASTEYVVGIAPVCDGAVSYRSTTFMTACAAISMFPYVEDFETSSVQCWSVDIVSGTYSWTLSSDVANSPSTSARFPYNPGASARLISPIFDLSSISNPALSFYYANTNYNGAGDSLAVYYRTSIEAEWTLLWGTSEPTSPNNNARLFIPDTILLPNPTATYQISFVGVGLDAYNVYVDDVKIEDAEGGETPVVVPPTVSTLAATEVTMTSATLNGTVVAGTETITAQGFEYKEATAATFTTVSAEATSFTATINNLTANTSYVYKSFATTASGTVYGSEMTFTTLADTTSGGGEEPCQPTTSAITETICQGESFDFNGTSYTTAGTYTATLVNAAGCDSVITLTLVVNPVTTSAPELVSICSGETYEWNGVTYNAAGTYTDTLTNAAGCDSIITLTLTVNVAEDTYDTVTVNAGETYEWNGETYTAEEGTYTAELADENGCAYTATLVVIVTEGLNDAENMINITLYPNPTTSNATLTVEGLNEEATIMLTDVQGRTIANTKLAQGQTTTTIETSDLTSGVYYIRLITSTTTRTEKLIKK